MPSSPYDAKGLLKQAIREEGPVMFIEHKLMYGKKGAVPEGEYTIPFGQANIVKEGKDATIVTISRGVDFSMIAAKELAKENIDVEVIDLRTLTPLDMDTIIQSIQKTNRLIIAHEAVRDYGWGAEVVAKIQEEAFDYLDAPIYRVASENTPVPYNMNLEKEMLLQAKDIVHAVKQSLYLKEVQNDYRNVARKFYR